MEAYIHDIPSFATFPHFTRHAGFAQLTQEKRTEVSRSLAPACNASAVTSACIRALYQLDTYTPTTSDGTPCLGMCVALSFHLLTNLLNFQRNISLGYIGENFNQADLKKYLDTYRPEASSYIIPVTTINGATNNGSDPVR